MSYPLPDPSLSPNYHQCIAMQNPLVLLAMCVFGEARGEPHPAKIAQACVVRNARVTASLG